MISGDFLSLVQDTDVTSGEDKIRRERVARFGLVSEVGSILSALKKVILRQNSSTLASQITKGELREELGDALWYVGMCANVLRDGQDIFSECLDEIQSLHVGKSADAARVEQLTDIQIEDFVKKKAEFDKQRSLDNFQKAAFCTARTDGDDLRDICIAVLQQLTAQLVRCYIPESETNEINTQVKEKNDLDVLTETAWHLAALATLNELKLSDIVETLQIKTGFRGESTRTKALDSRFPKQERFPDNFEIAFVPSPKDKLVSEMFWLRKDGYHTKLGASLQDNHSDNDGYRYHDAIHVAFAVHLGWSPNLRKFMGLKRKSDKKTDSDEDGGRAAILEEMIILQVHTYASKLKYYINEACGNPLKQLLEKSPFEEPNALTFEFIRDLHELSLGYEVDQSKEGDWKRAICSGYDMYVKLQKEGGVLIASTIDKTVNYRPLTEGEVLHTVGLGTPA